ncbi:hypothetical protein [Aquisalibacillus elongatus]|uniref:Uncharacterized protein n=1 Tax=Aquisalibacillus elongatus TaxID=485577 RepID=A0A3N5B4D1_9BACI|nr:hypothetical protein [Aquisalibacillus elongatus]RPF52127.1 hypothetical protein EDC24_2117 [Aquisalibacillus elongatus]
MKWLTDLEKILIEIGKSPEKKFINEQEKQQEWEKVLIEDEKRLDDWMQKIEKWFES